MTEPTNEGIGATIEVTVVNNEGGGFADKRRVAVGKQVGDLFFDVLGQDATPANYLIRVNREPCERSHTLQDGDTVTITPTKVKGAYVCVPVTYPDGLCAVVYYLTGYCVVGFARE